MEEAIKRAIKGGMKGVNGWKFVQVNKHTAIWENINGKREGININYYLLNPLFWKSLGKHEGWKEGRRIIYRLKNEWEEKQFELIGYINMGKNIDNFFKLILKKK